MRSLRLYYLFHICTAYIDQKLTEDLYYLVRVGVVSIFNAFVKILKLDNLQACNDGKYWC